MGLEKISGMLLATALLLIAPTGAFSEDIAKMIEDAEVFPEISADGFITQDRRPLFKWMSETEKDTAHYPAYSNSPKLEFLGFKIWDANMRFEDGKLASMDLSLYNRGDAGGISEENFEKLLKSVEEKISEWLQVKPAEGKRQRLPKNLGWIQSMSWQKGSLETAMKWSSSKVKQSREDKPEFIELTLSPAGREKPKIVSGGRLETQKDVVENLKDNIKNEENGDVWVDNIPMVDQGQKGYCAVAVVERILRYYGQEINQHVMAQLADTSAGGGTQTEHMMTMLKKAGTRFRVSVKEHMKSYNSRELQREMEKYNKFRRRNKLPQITPHNGFEPNYMQIKDDFDTFREYSESNKRDYKKFREAVMDSVDQGIPLVWGVFLGLCEEEKLNPQAFGGHLRIIVGYNEKTDEIIFSDTWGAGHEAKRMKWANAWAITTSYANVYPRK
ncbi:MAG: hypothetical protein JW808_00380 [Victivallales bacterium]|nr:hypothetical protein [Victivallales bacterium]